MIKKMKATKATMEQRIAVRLDPRVALESIILSRLERTPTRRRQEWLRSLLLQGFRSECRELSSTACDPRQKMTIPAAQFVGEPDQAMHRLPYPVKAAVILKRNQRCRVSKPFAALGKVVG